MSSIQDQSMQFCPAILDSPPRFKVVPFWGDIRLGAAECAIGMICRVEEREFPSTLIEDGRGLVGSVDAPKLLASQPSPSLNNRRLAGRRNLISDVYIARRSRLWLLFFGCDSEDTTTTEMAAPAAGCAPGSFGASKP